MKEEQKDEYFQSLLDDMDDLLKDMRQREKTRIILSANI